MGAKEDAQFLADLKACDPGIAERWQKVGGKLDKTVDETVFDKVFLPVFKGKSISTGQAKALDLFWMKMWPKFTDDAGALYQTAIRIAYDNELFTANPSARLKTADQLKDYFGAIGAAAGKLTFTSPGTGIAYTPDTYLAIKQLMTDGQIAVFEADAAYLQAKAGRYRSDVNRLVLYKTPKPENKRWAIVHEVTHAIQDWFDIKKKFKYTETDAFIAAAVAALGVNEATYTAMQDYPSQRAAAQIVLDKKAVLSNADWTGAYANVVKDVAASVDYSAIAETDFDGKTDEKGKNEKKILQDILQKMSKAKP
jgi:hypothetical protein